MIGISLFIIDVALTLSICLFVFILKKILYYINITLLRKKKIHPNDESLEDNIIFWQVLTPEILRIDMIKFFIKNFSICICLFTINCIIEMSDYETIRTIWYAIYIFWIVVIKIYYLHPLIQHFIYYSVEIQKEIEKMHYNNEKACSR